MLPLKVYTNQDTKEFDHLVGKIIMYFLFCLIGFLFETELGEVSDEPNIKRQQTSTKFVICILW